MTSKTDRSNPWSKKDACVVCGTVCKTGLEKVEHEKLPFHIKKFSIHCFLEKMANIKGVEGPSELVKRFRVGKEYAPGLECLYELRFDWAQSGWWACSICYESGSTYELAEQHVRSNTHLRTFLEEFHPNIAKKLNKSHPCIMSDQLSEIRQDLAKGEKNIQLPPEIMKLDTKKEDAMVSLVATDLPPSQLVHNCQITPDSPRRFVFQCTECFEMIPSLKKKNPRAWEEHEKTEKHRRCVAIQGLLKQFPMRVEEDSDVELDERQMHWYSINERYYGPVCGVKHLFRTGSENFCTLCFCPVESIEHHFGSETHIARFLSTKYCAQVYNLWQKSGKVRREALLKLLLKTTLDNESSRYLDYKQLPVMVKEFSLNEESCFPFSVPEPIPFGMLGECLRCPECHVIVPLKEGDDPDAVWDQHVDVHDHFKFMARLAHHTFHPDFFVPILSTLKASPIDFEGKWVDKEVETNMIYRTQTLCDIGLEYLVEDEENQEVICTLCARTYKRDEEDVINDHVRSFFHLNKYLGINELGLMSIISVTEKDSEKLDLILDWLKRNDNMFKSEEQSFDISQIDQEGSELEQEQLKAAEKNFRQIKVYSPNKALEIFGKINVSLKKTKLKYVIPEQRTAAESGVETVPEVTGDRQEQNTVDLREALMKSPCRLIHLDMAKDAVLPWIFRCMTCQLRFACTPATAVQEVWDRHLYSPEHDRRVHEYANCQLSMYGFSSESSTYTVKPFQQKDPAKKVSWQWNKVKSAFEFVLSVVGLEDLVERRSLEMFDDHTPDFFCRVCAKVIPRRAQFLEDHVRSQNHVMSFVNHHLPLAYRDICAAGSEKDQRRLAAHTLKDITREKEYCIPLFDPQGEKVRKAEAAQQQAEQKERLEQYEASRKEQLRKRKEQDELRQKQKEEQEKKEAARQKQLETQRQQKLKEEETRRANAAKKAAELAEAERQRKLREETSKRIVEEAKRKMREEKLKKDQLEINKRLQELEGQHMAKLIANAPPPFVPPPSASMYAMPPPVGFPMMGAPQPTQPMIQPKPMFPQFTPHIEQMPVYPTKDSDAMDIERSRSNSPVRMTRPSLAGRKPDSMLSSIYSKEDLKNYLFRQGAEQIPQAEMPELFNSVAVAGQGHLGIGNIYEVVCLDDDDLTTFYCSLCGEWATPSGMLQHLDAPTHKLAYIYINHKQQHALLTNEQNPVQRLNMLAQIATSLWMDEKKHPIVESRFRAIINRATLQRLWPESIQENDHSWKNKSTVPMNVPAPCAQEAFAAFGAINSGRTTSSSKQSTTKESQSDRSRRGTSPRKRSRSPEKRRRSRSRDRRRSRSRDRDNKRRRSRSRDRRRSRSRDRDRRRSRSRDRHRRSLSPSSRTDKAKAALDQALVGLRNFTKLKSTGHPDVITIDDDLPARAEYVDPNAEKRKLLAVLAAMQQETERTGNFDPSRITALFEEFGVKKTRVPPGQMLSELINDIEKDSGPRTATTIDLASFGIGVSAPQSSLYGAAPPQRPVIPQPKFDLSSISSTLASLRKQQQVPQHSISLVPNLVINRTEDLYRDTGISYVYPQREEPSTQQSSEQMKEAESERRMSKDDDDWDDLETEMSQILRKGKSDEKSESVEKKKRASPKNFGLTTSYPQPYPQPQLAPTEVANVQQMREPEQPVPIAPGQKIPLARTMLPNGKMPPGMVQTQTSSAVPQQQVINQQPIMSTQIQQPPQSQQLVWDVKTQSFQPPQFVQQHQPQPMQTFAPPGSNYQAPPPQWSQWGTMQPGLSNQFNQPPPTMYGQQQPMYAQLPPTGQPQQYYMPPGNY